MSFARKPLAVLTVINSLPRSLDGRCAPYISTQCILFYSENEDGVALHTDHDGNNPIRIVEKICDLEFSLRTQYPSRKNANCSAHQLTTRRTKQRKEKDKDKENDIKMDKGKEKDQKKDKGEIWIRGG